MGMVLRLVQLAIVGNTTTDALTLWYNLYMAKRKSPEQGAKTIKLKELIPNTDELVEAIALVENEPITVRDGRQYHLSFKQRLFCEKYLEFRGNGVEAVFAAGYKAKNAIVAKAIAYENLTKPYIVAYVNTLLDQYGFNDEAVTREHLFLINQYGDIAGKAKGVDMYYKLKGAYAPEKSINVNMNFKPDAKSAQLAAEFEAKLKAELIEPPQQ